MRIEPPVSEPRLPRQSPAAIAAAEPEEEPPVKRSVSQGLRAGGQGRSKAGPPIANSWVASLPSITAPASASRSTAAALRFGMWFSISRECAVVRTPAVS